MWELFRKSPANHLVAVARTYSRQLDHHGATAKGVLWKSPARQTLRFEVMANLMNGEKAGAKITVNDLGCGYGCFFPFLDNLKHLTIQNYYGYDISEGMIREAERRYKDNRAFYFVADRALEITDYSFASGTFNLKLHCPDKDWQQHTEDTLGQLWSKTKKAMAFNMLSLENEAQSDKLHRAAPDAYLDFCRKELSDRVELIDDYPLEDWTIFVRR